MVMSQNRGFAQSPTTAPVQDPPETQESPLPAPADEAAPKETSPQSPSEPADPGEVELLRGQLSEFVTNFRGRMDSLATHLADLETWKNAHVANSQQVHVPDAG